MKFLRSLKDTLRDDKSRLLSLKEWRLYIAANKGITFGFFVPLGISALALGFFLGDIYAHSVAVGHFSAHTSEASIALLIFLFQLWLALTLGTREIARVVRELKRSTLHMEVDARIIKQR